MAKVWRAAETTMYIVDAITPVDTATLQETVVAGDEYIFSDSCKNVTIAEPEGAVEKIDLLGVTSSFQNAELDFKPYGMARITGTVLHEQQYGADALLEEWVDTGVAYDSAASHVYQPGSGTYGDGRTACSILTRMYDGTDEVNILLGSAATGAGAYITKLGDRRISGADGHWEQDFEAVCLPKGYFVEYKD